MRNESFPVSKINCRALETPPGPAPCAVLAPFESLFHGVIMAKKGTAPAVNIGISDKDRKKSGEGLSRLLADTYTLYLKTHNFH